MRLFEDEMTGIDLFKQCGGWLYSLPGVNEKNVKILRVRELISDAFAYIPTFPEDTYDDIATHYNQTVNEILNVLYDETTLGVYIKVGQAPAALIAVDHTVSDPEFSVIYPEYIKLTGPTAGTLSSLADVTSHERKAFMIDLVGSIIERRRLRQENLPVDIYAISM